MKTALSVLLSAGLLAIGVPAVSSAQSTPPPSGIFLVGSGGSMTPIPSAMSQDSKTSGIGKSIATQGIMKPTQTVRYPGAEADFVIKEAQPIFFFRFVDQKEMSKLAQSDPMAAMAMMNGSGGGMLMGNSAKDYVLAKLQVDGDARVASSKGMETVKLQIEKKSPTEFEVRLATPLIPGQYAFFMGAMGGAPSQIYAFTVK